MITKTFYIAFFISSLQGSLVQAEPTMPSIEFLEYLAEMAVSIDAQDNSDWIDLLAMKEIENTQTNELTQEKGNE